MPPDPILDDEYAISVAQTEYRDAINAGDVDGAMAVIAESFTWMREGESSYWGSEGHRALRLWVVRMVNEHSQLTITPDQTELFGVKALSQGWEAIETPDARVAEPSTTRHRFFQTWEKRDGKWRMTSFICNRDVPPRMLEE